MTTSPRGATPPASPQALESLDPRARAVYEAVRAAVDVPIVLHGASGIPDDDVRRAIGLGVSKVNIHAELGMAAMDAIRQDTSTDFVTTQLRVRAALTQRALDKIDLLGSAGRASAMPMVEGDDADRVVPPSGPAAASGSRT